MPAETFDFYRAVLRAAEQAERTADLLSDLMRNVDAGRLPDRLRDLRVSARAATAARSDRHRALARAFVTPVDRGDILSVTRSLDGITDAVMDAASRLDMYGTSAAGTDAAGMASLILSACRALTSASEALPRFRKDARESRGPSPLYGGFAEVRRLAEEIRRLHAGAVRRLFASGNAPLYVMARSDLYGRLDACAAACVRAADSMEDLTLKNA